MTLVDYRTMFEHTPHLTLRYDPADPVRPWRLEDTIRGQLYARTSTFPQAESFMRAQEKHGDATVDWATVELLRGLAASLDVVGAFSVRVDNLAPGGVSNTPADVLARRTEGARTPEAGAKHNVYPLRRRMSEPLDEAAR